MWKIAAIWRERTIGRYPKSQRGFMPLTVNLLKLPQGGLLGGGRCEFIQSLEEGLCRFRYFYAFMTQKQVSVADFLLVILVIGFFIGGDNGAF